KVEGGQRGQRAVRRNHQVVLAESGGGIGRCVQRAADGGRGVGDRDGLRATAAIGNGVLDLEARRVDDEGEIQRENQPARRRAGERKVEAGGDALIQDRQEAG